MEIQGSVWRVAVRVQGGNALAHCGCHLGELRPSLDVDPLKSICGLRVARRRVRCRRCHLPASCFPQSPHCPSRPSPCSLRIRTQGPRCRMQTARSSATPSRLKLAHTRVLLSIVLATAHQRPLQARLSPPHPSPASHPSRDLRGPITLRSF